MQFALFRTKGISRKTHVFRKAWLKFVFFVAVFITLYQNNFRTAVRTHFRRFTPLCLKQRELLVFHNLRLLDVIYLYQFHRAV